MTNCDIDDDNDGVQGESDSDVLLANCIDVVCTQCADNDKWSHQRRSRKRHANEVESDVGNTASGSKEFVVIDKSRTISHMININITKMAKHGNVSINNAWEKVRLLRLQLPSM